MAEILTEIVAPELKERSIKILGKEYKLQKITMRKLLRYQAIVDEMRQPTEEKMEKIIKFFTSEIFVSAKAEVFEDMDTRWMVKIGEAIGKAIIPEPDLAKGKAVKANDPKGTTTPKR